MIMCKFETLIEQIKNLKVNLKHGINVSFFLKKKKILKAIYF